MKLLLGPLRKYAEFSGRAGLAEFWVFMIAVSALSFVARWFDGRGGDRVEIVSHLGMGMMEFIVWLVFLLPSLTVGVRRLHDTGRSGWWMLLFYLPWVSKLFWGTDPRMALVTLGALAAGGLALLVLFGLPGEKQSNMFGSPPGSHF